MIIIQLVFNLMEDTIIMEVEKKQEQLVIKMGKL